MTETRLTGLLRLFRFKLPFAAGVCVVLGSMLALGRVPTLAQVAPGFGSVFLIPAVGGDD